MPTYLIEINLSGEDTPKEEEKFYKLVQSFSDASRDSESGSESVDGEADSVGVNGMDEKELRGIIVIRTQPLPLILQILSPHLPHFHNPPKISQTTDMGIYDVCGDSVQQLLIYLPLHLHSSHSDDLDHLKEREEEKYGDEGDGNGKGEEKEEENSSEIQKLQTLFDVISIQLSRKGKISGMRQGEIKGISNSPDFTSLKKETSSPETKIEKEIRFQGQECRVWSVWTVWVPTRGKYDGCGKDVNSKDEDGGKGEEGESLAKRIDWGKMGVLGWEERNWVFMSFGEFLERGKEKKRCVVM